MPLQPLDQDGFLTLWRSLVPKGYSEPLEQQNQGAGLDPIAAHAATWERVEQALNRSQQAYYLRAHSDQTEAPASGPVKASGFVQVTRQAPTNGVLSIPAGTLFEAVVTDSTGQELVLGRYLATATTSLSESVGSFDVPVEAEFAGYTGNVAAGSVVRFALLGTLTVPALVVDGPNRLRRANETGQSRFTDSLVGRYVRLMGTLTSENRNLFRQVVGTYTDAAGQLGLITDLSLSAGDLGASVTVQVEEWADLGLTVAQAAPIDGGKADTLGAAGVDRNIGRQPGESDDAYRVRLTELADIISPASHLRIIDRILSPAGIGWRYLEVGLADQLLGFTWGISPWGYGQLAPIPVVTGSQFPWQGSVWLTHLTRFFVVLVKRTDLGDFGFPWGPSTSWIPGHANAWGVGVWGPTFPVLFNALVGQVWAALNDARAAGVAFVIVQVEDL